MTGFFMKLTYLIIYNIFVVWPMRILEGVETMTMKLSSQELLNFILFNDNNNDNKFQIPILLFYFSIAAVFLILILFIANFISAQATADPTTMKQKIVDSSKNSIKGGILIVVIPMLFLIFSLTIGVFQNILSFGINKVNNVENSTKGITQIIHDIGWIAGTKKSGSPGWNDFDGNYNPIIVIFGMIVFAINLAKLTMILLMRLLELVLLYFISPFIAAKMSSDHGASFHKWKEITISKFLIVLGIILAISISMTTINSLVKAVDNDTFKSITTTNIQKMTLKLSFVLAGTTFMFVAHKYISLLSGNEVITSQGSSFASKIKGMIKKPNIIKNNNSKNLNENSDSVISNHIKSNSSLKSNPIKKFNFSSFKKSNLQAESIKKKDGIKENFHSKVSKKIEQKPILNILNSKKYKNFKIKNNK